MAAAASKYFVLSFTFPLSLSSASTRFLDEERTVNIYNNALLPPAPPVYLPEPPLPTTTAYQSHHDGELLRRAQTW